MFTDEGSNVVVKSTEILSQTFLDILKELFTRIFEELVSEPLKNRAEIRKELKKVKLMEKRAEKLERENNCGYRDNEGGLISIALILKNKNELSEVELDFSFDNNGKAQKLEIIYETDEKGNKIVKLDSNGRPMLQKAPLTKQEKLRADAYLQDLKNLAKNRGLLCAVSESGVDLDGNGLFHSSLLYRTKDSVKLSSVISSLQKITALRSTLYEAGVEDAFSMPASSLMDLVEMKDDYDAEIIDARIKEQYKEDVFHESIPIGIEENHLKVLVENSNLESMKEVIQERYESIENFYQNTPTRKEIFEIIKESLSREYGQDMKRNYFHLYTDKENKLMFIDPQNGFHMVNLKNLEQEHFKNSKAFIRYMIKKSDQLEIAHISKLNLEKMERMLDNTSAEQLTQFMKNYFEDINKEYEEKIKITELKYKDSPLYEDEMSMKALVEFEMDGNDSIILKDGKTYLDVDMAVNGSPLVDQGKILAGNMDLYRKCAITNILELQTKYDFKIPDEVKEMLYKNEIDEMKLSLYALEHLYEKAEEDPRILRNPNECKEILKQGEKKNTANIEKALGRTEKEKTHQKEADVLGAGSAKDLKSKVSKSNIRRCEDIYNKYADGKIKPSKADMNVLSKNLGAIRNEAPDLYRKMNANKAIAREIANIIRNGWKEKGR